jgi:ankyrin repeat protein
MSKQIAYIALLFAIMRVTPTWATESLNQEMVNAVAAGDKAKVEALIAKGADVNFRRGFGFTPLHTAALYGQTDIAELLIAKGGDVKAKGGSGETPLVEAANRNVAALLIVKGADVNAKKNDGTTPLHAAVAHRIIKQGLAELLIAKGADVKAKDKYGRTPLLVYDVMGPMYSYDVVEFLIANGADVNAKDNEGNTLLHAAASKECEECGWLVELLIAKGADANIKNDRGETPLQKLTAQLPQRLTAHLQKSPGDQALREKIIALALALNPKPATPDAATMAEGAAEYAFKHAHNNSDYSDAAKQYEKALLLAPWLAADYFNCGVAHEMAGENKEAIRSFSLYLLAAPDADDAQAVKKRIGGLQYAALTAEAKKNAAAAEERRRRDYEDKIGFLAGQWNVSTDGQTDQVKAVITITDRNVVITRGQIELLKGTIEGDHYSSIKWVQRGNPNDPHTMNLPDYPTDVSILVGYKIFFKTHWVDTSTTPFSWSNKTTAWQLTNPAW